ncbi:FEKKY domain-containing protein [Elizabethkingia meningoseptica]
MRRLNFKEKYLRVFPVMNLLLIILIIRISYPVYTETKERIEEGEQLSIIQAKNDISNDLIIFEVPGGISDSYNEKLNQQIDSITKKYGVLYKNTGCVVDNIEIKIRKKYTALTERYLIQRNGKDWETKMTAEINALKKKNK